MTVVSIVGISGELERIDRPMEESVRNVRYRLAVSFGYPPERVKLLLGTHPLCDDLMLDEAVCSCKDKDEADEASQSVRVVTLVKVDIDYKKYVIDYGTPLDTRGKGFGRGHQAHIRPTQQAFARLGNVPFPKPTGIDINMMPFIIGDPTSIPEEYRHYWSMLERCHGTFGRGAERGRVGYLTIQESLVSSGHSQRRPHLHTEAPGLVTLKGGRGTIETHWGDGDFRFTDLQGGIYMASTVSDSCRVWNAQIRKPQEVVGHLGDIEPFRPYLNRGYTMRAGELFWITDTTPHESLPVQEDVYRQYFRFVTSGVTLWYEKHSTKNPLGITPDPELTQIVTEDKFVSTRCMYCRPAWVGWHCWHCNATVDPDAD
jgi:hypothetical protein